MTSRIRYFAITGLAALALGFAGCKKEAPPPPPPPPAAPAPAPKVEAPAPAPVSVASITLGKAIGADKKVTAATDTFAKADTIYASVDTTGTGNATLRRRACISSTSRDIRRPNVVEESVKAEKIVQVILA